MSYGRRSAVVRIGRGVQRALRHAGFLDWPCQAWLQLAHARRSSPLICLLSPPRSGSTLTYQVLAAGLNGLHLTNLSNLLYSLPATGALLTRRLCGRKQSTFRSERGFVPGLCGEAEGMAFWTHWAGQGLVEDPERIQLHRLCRLARILQRAAAANQPIVTGYLGHVFCIEQLKRAFNPVIFVHLKRDILSNAHSLYQASPESWRSVTPAAHREVLHLPRHAQVVEQVIFVHQLIRHHVGTANTFEVTYRDVCIQPRELINRLCQFAEGRGIALPKNCMDAVPKQFSHRVRGPQEDPDGEAIYSYLKQRVATMSPADRAFYEPLMTDGIPL